MPEYASGCLKTLGQGDHVSADLLQGGHVQGLQDCGALHSENHFDGRSMLPPSDEAARVVLDDLFVVAVGVANQSCAPPGSRTFELGRQWYRAVGLHGADDKEVYDAPRATLVGAELDASGPMRARGYIPLGSPVGKRLLLADISLRVASHRMRLASLLLASVLAGS